MTHNELMNVALEAVGNRATGWVMTRPSQGGEEIAFYDHDADNVRGMTRNDAAAILVKHWPNDPNAPKAIAAMAAERDERWVIGVSVRKGIFIWAKVRGLAVAGGSLPN